MREYNIANNTEYGEMDFKTPTKAYSGISCLTERLEPLAPFIGRSHVLRFAASGHFPPHRDSNFMRSDNFRIIGFFGCTHHTMHMALDNEILAFEKGRYYFLNTKRAHSLVSFQDNSYCVVFNIQLCDETVDFMAQYTFAK
ncbi:MAG: hypothetical protein HRT44_08490 [Bdellovibrionales bacterium]|nr:hypothetical protein [Bdellovibrionales bacterium]